MVEWCGIKVERSKQRLPCRRRCSVGCGTEEVQCEFGMGDKEVPVVGRKRRRCVSKYRKKMVLEGMNGSFRCIVSMDMWRDELKFAIICGYGPLEC